jgi:hypothetical protein
MNMKPPDTAIVPLMALSSLVALDQVQNPLIVLPVSRSQNGAAGIVQASHQVAATIVRREASVRFQHPRLLETLIGPDLNRQALGTSRFQVRSLATEVFNGPKVFAR